MDGEIGFTGNTGRLPDFKITVVSTKADAVLKGWAYENGKKVLVTAINGKSTWKDAGVNSFAMDLAIRGYSLIDPVTFHIVKSEVNYTSLNDPDDDDPMRISYSAEIE